MSKTQNKNRREALGTNFTTLLCENSPSKKGYTKKRCNEILVNLGLIAPKTSKRA